MQISQIRSHPYLLALHWFLAFSLVIYSTILVYIGLHVYDDTSTTSDVVIVLGAKSYKGDKYNPCLVSRVHHGIEVGKKTNTPIMLFTGGTDIGTTNNEAETMQKIAEEKGFAGEILLEKESTSTYENLAFSKKIMDANNLNSAIIVTEPFHSPRASLVANTLGIEHTVSPTTDSECWTRWKFLSRFFLREPFAIVKYWWEGWI